MAVGHDMQSKCGQLLISHPNFPKQSPFRKSLIYIYQDDSINGSVGVVLNKASRTSVSMLCEQNQIMFGDTQPMMYMGGIQIFMFQPTCLLVCQATSQPQHQVITQLAPIAAYQILPSKYQPPEIHPCHLSQHEDTSTCLLTTSS